MFSSLAGLCGNCWAFRFAGLALRASLRAHLTICLVKSSGCNPFYVVTTAFAVPVLEQQVFDIRSGPGGTQDGGQALCVEWSQFHITSNAQVCAPTSSGSVYHQ